MDLALLTLAPEFFGLADAAQAVRTMLDSGAALDRLRA